MEWDAYQAGDDQVQRLIARGPTRGLEGLVPSYSTCSCATAPPCWAMPRTGRRSRRRTSSPVHSDAAVPGRRPRSVPALRHRPQAMLEGRCAIAGADGIWRSEAAGVRMKCPSSATSPAGESRRVRSASARAWTGSGGRGRCPAALWTGCPREMAAHPRAFGGECASTTARALQQLREVLDEDSER